MIAKLKVKCPNFIIGVLFTPIFFLLGCDNTDKASYYEKVFLNPIDSMSFNYSSNSWKGYASDYSETRYGKNLFVSSNQNFCFVSIDSDNRLHKFDFSTSEHTYSKKICNSSIDAYKIDSTLIYLLYNNVLYTKDYQLNTIDSFEYQHPIINQEHGIDFTIENNSNLFKIKDYFVLIYYVVDEMPDGSNLYRSPDNLFYFFNRDTSFFTGLTCKSLQDTSFQYFRYPVVTYDDNFIYHAPRVSNCISKTNENSTIISSKIDTVSHNYLSIKHSDQYQISKLKKYRFSTDYNREIIVSDNCIYLLRETPDSIYYEKSVRKYKHSLEVKKFNKQLKILETFYISNKIYSYAYIKNNKLYLFDFNKNKTLIYEI